MKTKSWIKLIGILIIIFGAIGLIGDIFNLLSEAPSGQREYYKWHLLIAPYLGLFVNTLYLLSGIFFLQKKVSH